MKSRLLCLAALCLCTFSGSAWAEPEGKFKEILNRFITEALENNPEIQGIKHKISAYKEVTTQAGALDDPMLEFELMNVPTDRFSFTQEPMTQKQVSISQNLPYPGKLDLKTQIAQKDVEIIEKGFEETRLKIVNDVKQSYYELCFILASIDVTEQNKSLLRQFITVAQSKYSVGKGIQQDVLKAQVELSKIMDELIRLNKMREVEKSRLNTLMNRLPQAPISIVHGIAQSPFNKNIEEMQKSAEENRSALKEIKALMERFQVSRELAEKEYYPNFKLGVRYGQRENLTDQSQPDLFSAFVGINIPLWHKSKQSRKVAEENYNIEMTREAYNRARNQIFFEIKEIMDTETEKNQLLKLIKAAIIPQARQSLESAIAGYNVNKVDFLTLLDNQITLLNWEIKYHKELTSYEKNLAKLEQVVGKRLF